MQNNYSGVSGQVLVSLVAAGVIAFASTSAIADDAKADDEKVAGSGPSPYVDCGIGAALFPDTHWAAITSNVIWDAGTTAVTSATASPETCQGAPAQAAKLINDAYDNILEDTARGDGEYLVALLEIYGCSSEVQSDVVAAIREDVGANIEAEGYETMSTVEKAELYFNVINSEINSEFAVSCTA